MGCLVWFPILFWLFRLVGLLPFVLLNCWLVHQYHSTESSPIHNEERAPEVVHCPMLTTFSASRTDSLVGTRVDHPAPTLSAKPTMLFIHTCVGHSAIA